MARSLLHGLVQVQVKAVHKPMGRCLEDGVVDWEVFVNEQLNQASGRGLDRRSRKLGVTLRHMRITKVEKSPLVKHRVVHCCARPEVPIVDVASKLSRRDAVHFAVFERGHTRYAKMGSKRHDDIG